MLSYLSRGAIRNMSGAHEWQFQFVYLSQNIVNKKKTKYMKKKTEEKKEMRGLVSTR